MSIVTAKLDDAKMPTVAALPGIKGSAKTTSTSKLEDGEDADGSRPLSSDTAVAAAGDEAMSSVPGARMGVRVRGGGG